MSTDTRVEVWSVADIAAALGVSPRYLWDLIRNDECPHMPKPFGTIGNSRLWHAPDVRYALPALREWIDGAYERGAAKSALTRQQNEAAARLQAERQEREQAQRAQEYRDMQANIAYGQQQRAKRDAETKARQQASADLGTRLVNQNARSR